MHVRRALALATALPLLLAGCGGATQATTRPPIGPDPATSTATPTETPTVDPLAIPDAMRDKSLKGAEAAVRHYFDMYNHLIETGDAKPIKKLYGDHCSLCSAYVGFVELAKERGNSLEGSQTLKKAKAYSGTKGYAFVLGTYDSTPIYEITRSGRREQRTPGGGGRLLYTLAVEHDFWTILKIEVPQ